MKKEYGIHWFRRDLRVAGNIALRSQLERFDGRVVGIFCFDKKFLNRSDFSINRFQFFLDTLKNLKLELQELGGDLLVLDEGPETAFTDIINKLEASSASLPSLITCNRDYEPFARKRDKKMAEIFSNYKIEHETFRDHLIIEPHELAKDDGDPYKVFTPFSRKWLEIFESDNVQARIHAQDSALTYLFSENKKRKVFKLQWSELLAANNIQDVLEDYCEDNLKLVDIEIPQTGREAVKNKLKAFESEITNYGDARDFPAIDGTSQFSLLLKNGSLTTSQIISHFDLRPYTKKATSRDTFFSELIWREFYYHILYHYPEVENTAFNEKYKDIEWDNNKDYFHAWCEGRTGFPIVDAGMRQLNTTGWMHNRVRMIVASFLTKDLLIDWKWGEQYFMEKLLDGDLAPNNGGWQWAASTGCDAQPYFRIFNPWLQSKRFDPKGEYIKKYIPELSEVEAKSLHKPILEHSIYPEPIVDHSVQRDKALKLYKEL